MAARHGTAGDRPADGDRDGPEAVGAATDGSAPEASSLPTAGDGSARAPWRDALPPLVSAALGTSGESILARLRRTAARNPRQGRYKELGEIGRGGMGAVFRVWDDDLQRELAMKKVATLGAPEGSEEEASRERLLERFIDEARLTSQLDHPGIVPVHEIAVDAEGSIYFTMTLVRGHDLRRVFELARDGKEGWNVHRALGVLLKVALAVAFAHSKGVIHRDLKPANVMVGPYGETYVMDWGLALILGRGGRHRMVGTPAYMAPEQAGQIDREIGPRADVYSLGAILYELLAGSMPHQASLLEGESAAQSVARPPRTVRSFSSSIPPELVAICEKAMTWEPEGRYASALELAEDVRAWLENRVVRAHDTGRRARLQKWYTRNRGLAVALQCLAVVGLLSVLALLLLQRSKLIAVAAEREAAVQGEYAASLRAAALELRVADAADARRSLRLCPPELRSWEWRHLLFRSDLSLASIDAHGNTVRTVATAPDGQHVASGDDDGVVRIWSVDAPAEAVVCSGHSARVDELAFSPDGSKLASASADDTVRVWRSADGAELLRLEGEAPFASVAFHPDGKRLVAGDFAGSLRLWDAETGESLARASVPSTKIADVEWGPGGDWFLSIHNDAGPPLRTWSADGEPLRELPSPAGIPRDVAFSPDGGRLAAGYRDGTVRLLDPGTLSVIAELGEHSSMVYSVTWSPDGRFVVSGSADRTIAVWDPERPRRVASFAGHDGTVLDVAVLRDGLRLVSAAIEGNVRIWHRDASESPRIPGSIATRGLLALSVDGKVAALEEEAAIVLVELPDGVERWRLPVAEPLVALAIDRPAERVAFALQGGGLALHEPGRGGGLDLPDALPAGTSVMGLAFSPDGASLLVRADEGGLHVVDLSDGSTRTIREEDGADHRAQAFHPDGHSIAVGTGEGAILVLDVEDGSLLARLEAHSDWVHTLLWERDRLFSGSADGTAIQWDVDDAEPLVVYRAHKSGVSALATISDGRRLLTGSFDHEVRVWDVESGECFLTLGGENQYVEALAYDVEEDRVAAVYTDHTLRSWLTRTPTERQPAAPQR